VTFLITSEHLEKFDKEKIVEFIIHFVSLIEKDLSEIKLNLIAQTRMSATYMINMLTNARQEKTVHAENM